MIKLKQYPKDLFLRLRTSPFFIDNTREVNFFLFLGVFVFVIFVIDIHSELAVEKNEIDYVVAVLENINKEISLFDLSSFIFKLDTEGVLYTYSTPIQTNDVINFPRDRSPPEL